MDAISNKRIAAREEPAVRKIRGRGKSGTRLTRSVGGNILVLLFLAALCAFMGLPLLYSLVQSVKPLDEIFAYPPKFFVRNPTFDNFVSVYQLTQNLWVPLSRYLFNSVFVSVVGTAAYSIIASMCAFPLSRHTFPGKKVISLLIIWAMMFRVEVLAIPQYIIMSKTQMIDTYWAILLPPMAYTFGVFLMMQFMESAIPDSVLEAARIDGASEYRIFLRIIMPSVKPAFLTLIILTFQSMWNATGVNYVFDETLKTLPAVLSGISTGGLARAGASSAVAVILMIPPIVIFMISQSSVMDTMSHSGLK